MIDQTHALLSDEAKALTPEEFTEHVALARDVYGIEGRTFGGDDESRVDRALALQVNFFLAKGVEGTLFQSISRGGRSFGFRERLSLAHPSGLKIIRGVMGPGFGFESHTSVRGHGNSRRDSC